MASIVLVATAAPMPALPPYDSAPAMAKILLSFVAVKEILLLPAATLELVKDFGQGRHARWS